MTAPRRVGRVHWRGLAALYGREVRRGFKLWRVMMIGPPLRALLFALVFLLVAGRAPAEMGGLPFMQFLLAGLIAAATLEKAFEAAAFSILVDRIEGIIGDVLTPPLSALEFVAAYVGAAVTAGVMIGAVVWAALLPFGAAPPQRPLATLFFAASGAALIALGGILAALWADKWDRMSMVQTFVLTPLLFLSGIFFAIDRLPEAAQGVARINPIYYAIDGMRFGLTGAAGADPALGGAVVLASVACLFWLCHLLVARGYKLKP